MMPSPIHHPPTIHETPTSPQTPSNSNHIRRRLSLSAVQNIKLHTLALRKSLEPVALSQQISRAQLLNLAVLVKEYLNSQKVHKQIFTPVARRNPARASRLVERLHYSFCLVVGVMAVL